MPPVKKKDDEIAVVARLTVSGKDSPPVTVRRFDQAWLQSQYLASINDLPVRVRLDGFVRKDSVKDEFVFQYHYDD